MIDLSLRRICFLRTAASFLDLSLAIADNMLEIDLSPISLLCSLFSLSSSRLAISPHFPSHTNFSLHGIVLLPHLDRFDVPILVLKIILKGTKKQIKQKKSQIKKYNSNIKKCMRTSFGTPRQCQDSPGLRNPSNSIVLRHN